MSNLQEDLANAVKSIKVDSEKLHDMVQGDSNTTVSTDNGNVDSVAKTLNDLETEAIAAKVAAIAAEGGAIAAEGGAIAAKVAAIAAKNDAIDAKNDALSYKNLAEGYKNDAEGYKNDAEGYASDALSYKNEFLNVYGGSSPTPPPNPSEGNLWLDSSNNVLKVYTGGFWSVISNATSDIVKCRTYENNTNIILSYSNAYVLWQFEYTKLEDNSHIILDGLLVGRGVSSFWTGLNVEMNNTKNYYGITTSSVGANSGSPSSIHIKTSFSSIPAGNRTIKIGWATASGPTVRPFEEFNPIQPSGRHPPTGSYVTVTEIKNG